MYILYISLSVYISWLDAVDAFVVKVQRINLLLPKAALFAFSREAEFAELRTETARWCTLKLSTLKMKPSSR